MNQLRSVTVTAILAGILAILLASGATRKNPSSVASLAFGTEEAFATSGLEPRENLVGGGALRWLAPRASFGFEAMGPGLVALELEIRDHRTEVTVSANGARVGSLLPGERQLSTRVQLGGSSLTVGVETEGFPASGRTLGTQIVALRATPIERAGGRFGGPGRLLSGLVVVILVSALTQLLSGLGPLLVLVPPSLFLMLVLPAGLFRSAWLPECAVLVSLATILSALGARRARGGIGGRTVLQLALLSALFIHGILAPSPLMSPGDVQLHGNKLAEVASGNLFPTSRTDHKPPFEFPYGFSFYGLLAPFASHGVANVHVVRLGAAFVSALSALAMGWMLGRESAGLAAAAVALWAMAPVNLRTMGFGNLSNVFAQAVFVLFLVGASRMLPGWRRAALLSSLVALSAAAHLSSFIVLMALLFACLLIPEDRGSPLTKPLLAGLGVAAAYYASFLPMISRQLPRLLSERGGSAGVFDPWRLPRQILDGAGVPLVALIVLALLTGRNRPVWKGGASLALAGLILAIAALVSPLEVRYLLALMPLLATIGGSMFAGADLMAFPRQTLLSLMPLPGLRSLGSGLVSWPLATMLLLAASWTGLQVLLEFVPVSR